MIHTFQMLTEADSIQALLHAFVDSFNFVVEKGLTMQSTLAPNSHYSQAGLEFSILLPELS